MFKLGIDPGKNGGYALIDENKNLIKYGVLDTTSKGFKEILLDCLNIADYQLQVTIERPFLAQSSNDIMYINYGRILCNLELKDIEYLEIRSQQWLKYHKLKKTKEDKKPSKEFVQKLYPDKNFTKSDRSKVMHDGITDSICIALFNF